MASLLIPQIVLSEVGNLPWSGKDLCNVILTTPSQSDVGMVSLWQKLRRTPPIRDVHLRELGQIFFENDFIWFQIWWEL